MFLFICIFKVSFKCHYFNQHVVLGPVQTLLHSCAKPNWWIKYGKKAASESIWQKRYIKAFESTKHIYKSKLSTQNYVAIFILVIIISILIKIYIQGGSFHLKLRCHLQCTCVITNRWFTLKLGIFILPVFDLSPPLKLHLFPLFYHLVKQ